jgi:hypothetical protein
LLSQPVFVGDAVEFKVLYTGEDVPEVAQFRKKDDNLVRQTFAVLGAGMETHVIFSSSLRDAVSWVVLDERVGCD